MTLTTRSLDPTGHRTDKMGHTEEADQDEHEAPIHVLMIDKMRMIEPAFHRWSLQRRIRRPRSSPRAAATAHGTKALIGASR